SSAVTWPSPSQSTAPGGWPPIVLNEVLPRPGAVDWDGDGQVTAEDEWIELYNPGTTVDLGGWALDDDPGGGSQPYTIAEGITIPPAGYAVFFRSGTGVALNNDADQVRLLAPDGTLRDGLSYEHPRLDASFSRSVDGTGEWVTYYPPSPGGPNLPPPPTPTPTATSTPTATPTPMPDIVRLNEILPAPRHVDWNGDGESNAEDEWIELYHMGATPIDLGGWVLDDAPNGGSPPYTIPSGTILAPGGLLVLFRSETGLALNNDADEVRLLAPDGSLRDRFAYLHTRPDVAFARMVDGTGDWTDTYPPSPGHPNLPPTPTPSPTVTFTPSPHPHRERHSATATPTPLPPRHGSQTPTPVARTAEVISIALARRQATGTWVRVRGQVTVPPTVFGRSIYIQDASGGIQVYAGHHPWPQLQEGDWVEVQGRVADFHGESEIQIKREDGVRVLGRGKPPAPALIRCDLVGEAYEGMLVMVVGRVTGFGRREIRLSDGRAEVRVYVRGNLGWRRPWVERGQWWSAIGVVSQYVRARPYEGGYRLLPRYEDDLAQAPKYLPSFDDITRSSGRG
ncbi:MAG: lamin tail domain-containing protein, partial [Anaerolineae bacterium]|nr:lamin tail domain-containing protein [Anaerolineae bacterium]